MLRAININKSFDGNKIIDGLNIQIAPGEVVLLRGDNGSGKTTLLNILTGHLKPDKGEIHLDMADPPVSFTFGAPYKHRITGFQRFCPEVFSKNHVGRTWQDLRLFSSLNLLDNLNVSFPHQLGENLFWPLIRPLKVQREEKNIRQQGEAMLDSLGLTGRYLSSADMISLGQSKRVSIARSITNGAKFLLLDEPLAGLDSEGCDKVTSVLKELAVEKGMGLVIVEHSLNMHRILKIATTVWTMYRGRITRQTLDDYVANFSEEDTKIIAQFLRRNGCSAEAIREDKLPGGASLSVFQVGPKGQLQLELKKVGLKRIQRPLFAENKHSSSQLSFVIRQGQIAILRAPNGWGKTSLMDAIMGELPISHGEILLSGSSITRDSPESRRRKGLTYVRVKSNIFPGMTVGEHFRLSESVVPNSFSLHESRHASDLSGGEQMRLALESTLNCPNIKLALIDEPFYSLDDEAASVILTKLFKIAESGAVLIAVPGHLL